MARTPFKMLISFDRIIKRTLAPLYPLESCCVLAQMSIVAPPRPPAASMLVLLSQQRSAQSLVTKLSGPIRSGDAATTACHLGSLQSAAGDRPYIGPNTTPYLLLKVDSPRPAYAFTCIRVVIRIALNPCLYLLIRLPLVCNSHQGRKSTWRWILAGEYSRMLCCMV